MQFNSIDAPLQMRILIGSSETLSSWIAVCPDCHRGFRLQWPNSVLHIELHRVVNLTCPVCGEKNSIVAASLVLDEEGQELPTSIVQGLA